MEMVGAPNQVEAGLFGGHCLVQECARRELLVRQIESNPPGPATIVLLGTCHALASYCLTLVARVDAAL